jgi:transcriptional/translational regulatory protein YebC/TACO1
MLNLRQLKPEQKTYSPKMKTARLSCTQHLLILQKCAISLKDSGLEITDAELTFVPNNTIEISDKETARKVINLMNALDDLDDVTTTHTNFDIAENIEV